MTVKARASKRSAARGGRPTKASAAAIEDRILATASRFFARDGYAATSVEQVALACGAGKDTIYRRFPSKRALFTAVIDRTRVRVLVRLEGIVDQGTGRDSLARLKNVARWLLDVNLDPELIAFKRIALSESVVVESNRNMKYDSIMQRLVSLVAEAQTSLHLAGSDAAFVTEQLISSIITGPTIAAMHGHAPFGSDKDRDAYFDKAWKLFIRGAGRLT
jgi:AcrR family transcriptional regulator